MGANPGMTECNPRITKSWNDMDANPGMTSHPGISCDRASHSHILIHHGHGLLGSHRKLQASRLV